VTLSSAELDFSSHPHQRGDPEVLNNNDTVCHQVETISNHREYDAEQEQPLARLNTKDFEFIMTKQSIIIGRNSGSGSVDVHMGQSSFISRHHMTIAYNHLVSEGRYTHQFTLECGGKNGVFIDETFQRRGAPPVVIPNRYVTLILSRAWSGAERPWVTG